jgi:CubicO group peptidase (beta-lactamase class C family)
MSRWKQHAAVALVSVLAVAGLAVGDDSVVGASTRSLSPEGGGVPTTKTDASRYKNCQEPPGDSLWQTARPEEVGLDAAALQKTADYYRDQLQGTMRVYRFGCLVQTGAFDAVTERMPTQLFSNTKPVMTLVVGRAIELGKLSLDDTVGKYFPDRGDEAHRAVTLRQLLTHTSGIYKNWTMDLNDNVPDEVDHFMHLPFRDAPGAKFEYSQVSCNVASAMVEKAVGVPFQRFAQQELFDKIGIVEGTYFWKTDRAGQTYGYSGLYLRPIDMIRIGQLEINKGTYRGERIISERFINEMGTGTQQNPGFGYNTWVNAAPHWVSMAINSRQEESRPLIASAPHDMTFSVGWRGRHIFVMPNLGMVVTATPLALEAPTPPSFIDGYVGQGPGTGPGGGGQYDGQQIAQGEVNAGYHEFFRILMAAVADQKIGDPGPWDQKDDNAFDPDLVIGAPDKTIAENEFGNTNYNGWAEYQKVAAVDVKAQAVK